MAEKPLHEKKISWLDTKTIEHPDDYGSDEWIKIKDLKQWAIAVVKEIRKSIIIVASTPYIRKSIIIVASTPYPGAISPLDELEKKDLCIKTNRGVEIFLID